MRVSPAITNFTAGEWSPQMLGQIDLETYNNACRKMRNFIARVHGGAQKRPGTYLVAEVKNSNEKPRLVPFQYSMNEAYCIEAGNAYFRFMRDGGVIVNESDAPYELGSPYSQEYLSGLRWAQDKDILYFFHRYHRQEKLTRYDHNDWEIKAVTFTDGPYLPQTPVSEIGDSLVPNGKFEEDSGITSIGSPVAQKRSSTRFYDGSYSRMFVSDAANQGFRTSVWTTSGGATYLIRFRVFTRGGTFKVIVRKGNDSGNALEETIADVPENQWVEYTRYYTEGGATGGANAFLSFTSATAIALDDTNKCPNPGFESAGDWYKVGTSIDAYSGRVTSEKKTGSYSYQFRGDGLGNSAGVRSNPFITETGKLYRVRFWFKSSDSTVTLQIRRGDDSALVSVNLTGLTTGSWTQVTHYYEETAGGASAYIGWITANASSHYIDDIEFQEIKTQFYFDNAEGFPVSAITLIPSATTGTGVTLTASSALFLPGHVGAFFRLRQGETTGYCLVTGYTSATAVTVSVLTDFGDTTATPEWREGAWSDVNGYPACGAFHEQRLFSASSVRDPDVIWGSKTTAYEDYTPGIMDSDPVAYKLQADTIRWLSPLGQLVAGTVNAEYRLGAQGSDQILTPMTVKLTPQSRKGSADIAPVNVGAAILFAQRRGKANYAKKLRELSYNYMTESYDGVDLTLYADHITGLGITHMAYMASPFPIVWAVTADGYLIGMTYEREQKVIAWHIHPTDGVVEDVCVVAGTEQDDVYLLVKREINGVEKRYIEIMMPFDFGDLENAFFVDCGLTYDGEPTDAISGLDHLEGCAVAVLADGKVHPNCTVENGEITLDYEASKVHVGLPYVSELEPLDLQGGSMEGTSQGKVKRIHGITLSLYQSMGGEIGQDAAHTERIFFRTEQAAGNESIPLYSGLTDDFGFRGNWQLSGLVYIKHDDPLPFTVLSILPRFRTEDR